MVYCTGLNGVLYRIWAADMASVNGGGAGAHQYEMVNKNKHYDTIRSVRSQSRMSGILDST